jgi:hypothetical protein
VKTSEADNLNEQDITAAILDAARAITVATGSLVNAATISQRERISKSRDPAKMHFYRNDPAWTNGLISAAQAVGGTTQDLVQFANGFVKKEDGCDEEILIAAANQVAAATARLLAASRAKSDSMSGSHQKLADASMAIGTATQTLVDAARRAGKAIREAEEQEAVAEGEADGDISAVQARRAQLRAQAEMYRLETELEKARLAYTQLNKEQYAGPSTSTSSGSTSASGARPLPVPRAAAKRGN